MDTATKESNRHLLGRRFTKVFIIFVHGCHAAVGSVVRNYAVFSSV